MPRTDRDANGKKCQEVCGLCYRDFSTFLVVWLPISQPLNLTMFMLILKSRANRRVIP